MKVKYGDNYNRFKLQVFFFIIIGKMYLFVCLHVYVFIIQVNTVTAYPFLQFKSFQM